MPEPAAERAAVERPILFSAPMVRTILERRKTQTRRLIRPERLPLLCIDGDGQDRQEALKLCPYGLPGDGLWVRETHWRFGRWVKNGSSARGTQKWKFKPMKDDAVAFMLNGPNAKRGAIGWHKRPSIFLPRWASRIMLEILDIRVQRLQEISEADAQAEGCSMGYDGPYSFHQGFNYRGGFMALWDSINGKRAAWATNPWVWAVTFKRLP